MIGKLLAAGAAGWVAYAWGAHLLTPACRWRGPRDRAVVALTFDDGPDAEWTPRVLDCLAGHGVRATFFVIGERAERAPAVVRRAVDEGHEIGNHSWSHRSPWLCAPRATDVEVGRAHDLLTGLAGRPPRHFRPPWGMVNAALFGALRRHGERCVFWSIQPEGLRPAPADRQVRHVLRRAHPGAIVDLHDAEGTPGAPARLLTALPSLVEGLRDRGYAFATIEDLLDPAVPASREG